jgi:acid phosphatase type 7
MRAGFRRATLRPMLSSVPLLLLGLLVSLGACTTQPSSSEAPPSGAAPVATLLAAGDVAACDSDGDEATAEILAGYPDATIAILGDLVYPAGNPETFEDCFMPSWGPFVDRVRPTLGHHDVRDDDGLAYFELFGDRAGQHGEGWYAYELGEWQILVLNSLCGYWYGCREGTLQHDWLLEQLEASDARCTLAYWHSPRFSSGMHGDYPQVEDFWIALHDAGAELVLNGHEHNYERFAPMRPDGSADPDGITQFIVGTGGKEHREVGTLKPNSEVALDDVFGILVLELRPDGYDYEFVTTEGEVADAGSGTCH